MHVRGSPPYSIYYKVTTGVAVILSKIANNPQRIVQAGPIDPLRISLHNCGHVPLRSFKTPSFLEVYRIHTKLQSGAAFCLDKGRACLIGSE